MQLIKGRFDHLSREDAITLLEVLEGPLLELELGGASGDTCAADVPMEVLLALQNHPRLQLIFLTDEEDASWQQFRAEHGDCPTAIGDFIVSAQRSASVIS